MDRTSLYYKRISERTLIHFIKGLIPRIKCYLKYKRARTLAIKNGAQIGDNTIIQKKFARQLNRNIIIGNNTSIEDISISSNRYKLYIGNNVIINHGVKLVMGSHRLDTPEWEHYRPTSSLKIEDYVWIAPDAVILPSCSVIGYGSVIGANAVVVKDVPPMSILGGNPAKVIKQRECVHSKLVIPSLLSGDLKIYWNTWINRKK